MQQTKLGLGYHVMKFIDYPHLDTQEENIHALSGTWNCDPSNQVAADLPFLYHTATRISWILTVFHQINLYIWLNDWLTGCYHIHEETIPYVATLLQIQVANLNQVTMLHHIPV